MKNSRASTGELLIQSFVTDMDLEATAEHNIFLPHQSHSKKERMQDREYY